MANYSGRGFQRRQELAREKGFASYAAYRRASAAERAAATRRLAGENAAYARTNAAAQIVTREKIKQASRRRLIDLGGDRQILRSINNRELYAFLVRAEKAELRVFAVVEVNAAGGKQIIELWKRGGIDPAYILDELRAAGSRDVLQWLQDYIDNAGGNTAGVSGWAAGSISMVTLSSGAVSEGIAA